MYNTENLHGGCIESCSYGLNCGINNDIYDSACDLFRNTPSCSDAIGNSQKLDNLSKWKKSMYMYILEMKCLYFGPLIYVIFVKICRDPLTGSHKGLF